MPFLVVIATMDAFSVVHQVKVVYQPLILLGLRVVSALPNGHTDERCDPVAIRDIFGT